MDRRHGDDDEAAVDVGEAAGTCVAVDRDGALEAPHAWLAVDDDELTGAGRGL